MELRCQRDDVRAKRADVNGHFILSYGWLETNLKPPPNLKTLQRRNIVKNYSLSNVARSLGLALAVLLIVTLHVNAQTGDEKKAPPSTTETTEAQDNESVNQRGLRPAYRNAHLNDRYGFHVLALRLDSATPTTGASTPFAISGYYQFNGDGTLIGRDTLVMNLMVTERQYEGTYQVNPDGTGTLKLNMSPTFQPEGRFVITKGGEQIEIIYVVPGNLNLNAFTLYKQGDPIRRKQQ
jgi:hypothetical protein